MAVRRFTRLTNAFSKRVRSHVHAVALSSVWYHWCRRYTDAARHAGDGGRALARSWLLARAVPESGRAANLRHYR